MNYENKIENLLTRLPHKLQVRFALDCALDVKDLMGPESIQALDFVEKWLKGEATQAEVEAAAYAYNAAYAATRAAYNAYNASAAASRAAYNAAYAASSAASAASPRGAYNAYNAAYAYNASAAAYAYATGKNRDKKIKEYYENLRSMILNMSELEKLVYNV
jgi:cytochrome oxidase Cu insertion factor (SCO1/SenC/PrrC family)